MYDVLIVDDESVARASLKYLIDWKNYGFDIKAEAIHGEQALDFVKTHYFSLILTDVRMPTMNGLEFIARLREFSDAAVIILSGYEDFEYARQGLKMGVQDYLLKPVDEDDLIAVLQRMQKEIAQKYLAHKQLKLGLSFYREQFLRKWSRGQVRAAEFNDHIQLLNMQLKYDGFFSLLVEMDFFHPTQVHWTDQEIELKRFAVRNIIEEVCEGAGHVFEDSEERYGIILIGTKEELQEKRIFKLAELISESVRNYAKETVSIGLGTFTFDNVKVFQSFVNAEASLDGKFLMGNNTILSSNTLSSDEFEVDVIHVIQAEVLEAIKSYHRDHLSKALDHLWEGFKDGKVQEKKVKLLVLEILVQLLRTVKETGVDHYPLFDYALGDYEQVMKAKTINELHLFTEKKCLEVLKLIHKHKDFQPNQMIETVKGLVQQQYQSNISLRSAAQQVFMNPIYLGQLFKADTGCSFSDYVLKTRMEKAKELLLHTDKKVYEIAMEVGYRQLDWFYKRFKAYTGFSAGEYRSSF